MSRQCRQDRRRNFTVYDQAVDIVSCWEAFAEFSYDEILSDFYFDRFPTIPRSGEDDLTPDFTIYFDDNYGIIGEIKRTFPEDDRAFNSTVDQLSKYDDSHSLKTSSGSRVEPDVCDVVTLISGSDAPQIGTRISDLREQGEFNFENNLVVLRYQYNTTADLSRYEFQRVTQVDDEFQDSVLPLPSDKLLSSELGEQGSYGTMKVYPTHFTSIKVKTPVCNDDPPTSYLATILWHKIFPEYLTRDDFHEWRQGNAQKTIPLKITLDEIQQRVNEDYLQNGHIRKTWIRDALDFLATANLARSTNDGYEIQFRGLVRNVGEENHQKGTQELDQMKELATRFINRYCEYSDEGNRVTENQKSINEF